MTTTKMTRSKVGQLSQFAALAAFLAVLAGCSDAQHGDMLATRLGAVNVSTFTIVHDLESGFPSAPSGTASFYLPGTLTLIPIYGDASGTTQSNPVTLDVNGAAHVWLSQLARMIVQTNGGVTVSDSVINQEGDIEVANTSAAFSATTQKGVNDSALVAFGGVDFGYVPSGSWVGMTPKNWMNSVMANVMAYGSVGATAINNGVTPADSAIAAAIADVGAAGGGIVYFPPGTYLLNSTIAVTHSGITFVGAGIATTTLQVNTASDGITTVAGRIAIRSMYITATAPGPQALIRITTSSVATITDVKADGAAYAVYLDQTSKVVLTGNNILSGTTVALYATTADGLTITGGNIASIGLVLANDVGISGGARIGVIVIDSLSSNVSVIGNQIGGFTFTGAAEPANFYQYGNGIEGYTIGILSGATGTPDRSQGELIRFEATTTGSPYVIAPPTPTTTKRGTRLITQFYNHAGGAVTGWTLDATYKASAAIPTTDAHIISVTWEWDGANWREVARADTAA